MMQLPERSYRWLVLVNTAILLGLLLIGMLTALAYRHNLRSELRSRWDRQIASSKLVEMFREEPDGTQVDYPLYEIKIRPNEMRQIEAQLRELRKTRVMTNDLQAWYPARFYHQGEEYKIKIRLRGDLENHWFGEKKSWRIKFKKDRFFQGRRTIDLVIPADKEYQVELVAYDLARELGLLVPDAGFANIQLNGVDFGAYFWIEKYGAEMVEKQGYPGGEIFRHQDFWLQTRFNGLGVSFHDSDEMASPLHASSIEHTMQDPPTLGHYMQRWDQLIWLLRDADDTTFEAEIPHLLNIEKYLAFNALTWMFGSIHAHLESNLRWYYDNTSGLLEPILYDVSRYPIRLRNPKDKYRAHWKFETEDVDRLARKLLQIPRYRQRRGEILWRLLNDEQFDPVRRSEAYFVALRRHFLTGVGVPDDIDKFNRLTGKILTANREELREHMTFARVFMSPVLTLESEVPTLQLEMLPDSRGFIGIEQASLQLSDADAAHAARTNASVVLVSPDGARTPVTVAHWKVADDGRLSAQFKDLVIWTPIDDRLKQIPGQWSLQIQLPHIDPDQWRTSGFVAGAKVDLRSTITGEPIENEYLISSPLVFRFDGPGPSLLTRDIDDFIADSGLPFVKRNKTLVLDKGEHTVRGILTVPAGWGVHLNAGTVLSMARAASLVCYGPLTVDGTEKSPVKVRPADEAVAWGVIASARAQTPSQIRHLHLHGGSEAYINGIYFSGQLCFYWSDVEMNHCIIADARADDGLNVKKAMMTVRDSLFVSNLADALDADWVTGSVQSSIFLKNSGDGLDTSGSTITAVDCLFEGMADKGLSLGEKSTLTAANCVIRDCGIGMAVKDLSTVNVYASVFYQNKEAIAVYRKKQIFGGASGNVAGSLFWENDRVIRLDSESKFTLADNGIDRWSDVDRVTADAILQNEDIARFYVVESNGSISAIADKIDLSPSKISRSTEPVTVGDLKLSDRHGDAAGLVRPLSLDPALLRLTDHLRKTSP